MPTWQYGALELWRLATGVATWRHGGIELWRSVVSVWRHCALEVRSRAAGVQTSRNGGIQVGSKVGALRTRRRGEMEIELWSTGDALQEKRRAAMET